MCPGKTRGHTEVTLVSVDLVGIEALAALPPSMEKYRQWPKINGTEVMALRDTGASITIVMAMLVSPDQIMLDIVHRVVNVDNETKFHPMALVNFGGVGGVFLP